MKIHFIIHEAFESPGAITEWAKQKNHSVSYTCLFLHEQLPQNCDNIDFLIIMGGPQSPDTTLEECPYFDAQAEQALIKNAIRANKLVLGVCLGAQLIGEALGAKYMHSPNKEIGVFEVTMTEEAKSDALFSTFPANFPVGHWHNDMPGLTSDAKILAVSKGCPRQIVKYAPTIYGFQCHFEFTIQSIEDMIKHCGNELKRFSSLPYVQSAEELKAQDYTEMNKLLFKFLDHMQKFYERSLQVDRQF